MKFRHLFTALSLAASFSFAGCGDSVDADADKFVALADEACKCADLPCAEKVKEKWEKLEDEMKAKYKDKEVDEKKMAEIGAKVEKAEEKARACGEKLEQAGSK